MSASLPRKDLAEALLDIVIASDDTKKTIEQIAAYLVTEGQAAELDALLRDMEDIQLNTSSLQEVQTSSAYSLSADVKRAIESLFDAEHVRLHESIDKQLVGGVRVRSKDTVMDLSIRTQLNRLKHSVKV
ncbi:MAG: F0F1 ATP synthase subunit delta [Actinobacteria bacterium]|nr:F0F1 ATP synthase subunit delta [Actinomycetota bacterium]